MPPFQRAVNLSVTTPGARPRGNPALDALLPPNPLADPWVRREWGVPEWRDPIGDSRGGGVFSDRELAQWTRGPLINERDTNNQWVADALTRDPNLSYNDVPLTLRGSRASSPAIQSLQRRR